MTNFGKAVAEEYRNIRNYIAARQAKSDASTPPATAPMPPTGPIDGQVKEQIVADIDRLINKNDPSICGWEYVNLEIKVT